MTRTLSTALLAIAWLMPAVIRADGLSKEMEKLFGDMTHVTQPGIVASQQRGVFTGGRFTVKSHIAQENLVSLTPPSWKAGCGGDRPV